MKHRALRMSRRRSSGIRAPSGHLTTRAIVEELNAFLTPGRFTVVADVGDCMYACVDLRTDIFLGPGYYNSMGFAVPAAIAAELAWPKRRAVALVGDGGFQMTGMDLGTAGTRRPSWPRWAPNLPGFLGVKPLWASRLLKVLIVTCHWTISPRFLCQKRWCTLRKNSSAAATLDVPSEINGTIRNDCKDPVSENSSILVHQHSK